MGISVLLIASTIFLSLHQTTSGQSPPRMPCGRRVCHYSTDHVFERGTWRMFPERLGRVTSLCTHIIFSTPPVRERGFFYLHSFSFNRVPQLIQQMVSLRNKFPGVKVLFNVDSRAASNTSHNMSFENMVNTPQARSMFVKNAVEFVEKYDLDGINLYWDIDINRHEIQIWGDKTLFNDLRNAFEISRTHKKCIIVLSVTSMDPIKKYFSEFKWGIASKVDFMIVHTYDDDGDDFRSIRTADGVKKFYWTIKYGHFSFLEQLVITVPLLGESHTVDYRGKVIGKGQNIDLKYTGEKAYYGVCYDEYIKAEPVTYLGRNGPWGQSYRQGDQLVLYNGEESVRAKARLVIDQGLGGLMIQSINHDDSYHLCPGKSFPLIRAINDECYTYNYHKTGIVDHSIAWWHYF